jgi:hypothetical protein
VRAVPRAIHRTSRTFDLCSGDSAAIHSGYAWNRGPSARYLDRASRTGLGATTHPGGPYRRERDQRHQSVRGLANVVFAGDDLRRRTSSKRFSPGAKRECQKNRQPTGGRNGPDRGHCSAVVVAYGGPLPAAHAVTGSGLISSGALLPLTFHLRATADHQEWTTHGWHSQCLGADAAAVGQGRKHSSAAAAYSGVPG